ncbi:MAG TPA: hypothetical protein VJP86_03995 [Vicinamibacterales bacterium]|nr:hypothetical protein [Vicinamibacterales bacterium]
MITDALHSASLVAKASMFMGVLPLALGLAYAVWPSEARLALMRPLSLATIYAAVAGTTVGFINVLMGLSSAYSSSAPSSGFPHLALIGLAESLVPVFFGFGCLTIAWLSVALGLWRKGA